MFNDGNTPSELVIPNRNKVSSPSSQNQRPEVTTTSSPRSEPTAAPDQNKNTAPAGSCQGTCVTGFFALLCDEIDRKADCPGNGRCCLTKKVGNRPSPPPITAKCPGFCLPQSMSSLCTKPSNILHNTKSCNKGTVCCESREPGQNAVERTPPPPTRTTTKRPAPPPPQRPQRPSGGGGPDLTSLLLSAAPSILSAATGNSDAGTPAAALLPVLGSVLGGSSGGFGSLLGGGAAPNRNPSQGNPGSDQGAGGGAGGLVASLLPTLVGTFLGGGGGGGGGQQQRIPPRVGQAPPYRPPPTPAPTLPPTTTEPADLRPDCPGTCIASYLSFTCFGKFVKNHHVYQSTIPSFNFSVTREIMPFSSPPFSRLN